MQIQSSSSHLTLSLIRCYMSEYLRSLELRPSKNFRLSHIVHGPHDGLFDALWNELRSEYKVLVSKGYTGEGFLAKGRKLGGRRIPLDEMRRQARAAAEKRHREKKKKKKSSGQKLGGKKAPLGADVRKVIADAAIQRNIITKGCASGTPQGTKAAEEAKRNGFRTKAEEDDANDLAIAKALIELMEEDETRNLEGSMSDNNDSSEGLNGFSKKRQEDVEDLRGSKDSLLEGLEPDSRSKKNHSSQADSSELKVFSLLAEAERKRQEKRKSKLTAAPISSEARVGLNARSSQPPIQTPKVPVYWTCSICTLNNPGLYLCCDACGTERPEMHSTFDASN